MYKSRLIDDYLEVWKNKPRRKSLLIRGVRQCGKTSSIRNLGRKFRYYAEFNFEADKDLASLFKGNIDIDRIIRSLEIKSSIPIKDGETLLFFDEIQFSNEAIESLRFFHEKRPGLHVAAAGSLLEFALMDLPSFGVGRVENLFMYPLSFSEFLRFSGEEMLDEAIREGSPEKPLDEIVHQKALSLFKDFVITGGFPDAVNAYISEGSFLASQDTLEDLMTSFQDDFAKYRKHIPEHLLSEIFNFTISRNRKEIKKGSNALPYKWNTISEALFILEHISLIHPVYASDCSALPIGSDSDKTLMKLLPCDTALYLTAAGLDLTDFIVGTDFSKLNIGGLIELAAGLEIIKAGKPNRRPELYYWKRRLSGDNHGTSEVDYVIQKNTDLIPIEVKGRTQGGMKSMWKYLEKGVCDYGIRTSFENFSSYDRIKVIPVYAIAGAVS